MESKIKSLREKLIKWENAYHVLDNPLVSDEQYDGALIELKKLEEKYPEYKTSTSPTQRVGGEVLDVFTKRSHSRQMLSLANAFNEKDLDRFNNNIAKTIDTDKNIEYVVEPKIDGLSISLVYDTGKLQYGITRGNGIIGEDVTHNIRTIKSIPLEIEYKGRLEIRGEVFISKDTFEELNKIQRENNLPEFANPRNAAAGALRQLDSKIASSRKLKAFMYYLPYAEEMGFKTHYESIEFARTQGFNIAKEIRLIKGRGALFDAVKWLSELRDKLEYEIDGIVFKLNNLEYYGEVGYTAKAPKWAIAYKFPAEIASTELVSIFATTGRTGRVTYNAELSPVRLAGSTVSFATLHNAEYIEDLDIRAGDIVRVKKAGDIIPKVLGPVIENRDGKQVIWKRHSTCPSCGSELEQIEGEVDQYCINNSCSSRIIESLTYFCSRDGMEITGMGPSVIKELYNFELLRTFSDIYKLHNHKDEMLSIERFAEKKVNNILEAIEASKTKPLDKFLTALGIRHVGSKIAKTLAECFTNIESIIEADYHSLEQIDQFGEMIAQSVVDFFANQDNRNMIQELKDMGVEMQYISKVIDKDSKWSNKKIVITGTLSKSRNSIKEWLESKGAIVTSSLSKTTDFLLVGENAGSKYDKAIKLGVEIIKEDNLI